MKLRISFPRKGSPPPCPEGYEQERGDPFSFTLKWLPCLYHGLEKGNHMCALFGKYITQLDCQKCEVRCELPKSNT